MASIKKIVNKSGLSYKITVTHGRDINEKQMRSYLTWVPPYGMTPHKMEKELKAIAFKFEESVRSGAHLDNTIKFRDFAEKWLKEYAEKQLKIKTVDGYKKLLPRIYAAIGHIKLKDLKTGHINTFYANLQEAGMNAHTGDKAKAKDLFFIVIAEREIAPPILAQMSKISRSTAAASIKGDNVSLSSAKAISQALKLKTEDVFDVSKADGYLSPATIRAYHRLVSSILTKAVKWGYIPFNPAVNTELPRNDIKEASHLDEKDARRLLQLLHKEPIKYRAMITFALLSGLRRGELLGLRWQDVDFESETITISQALSYVTGKGIYTDKPKNKTSSRPLKLSRSVFLVLSEYKDWQDAQREACGDAWKDRNNRVFTGDDGAPIHPDALTKWFTLFAKQNGLPPVHLHSLRHTYASIMIAEGTPLVVVSKRLGHAQVSTTANIYSHLIASADEKAAQVVEKFSEEIGAADDSKKAI